MSNVSINLRLRPIRFAFWSAQMTKSILLKLSVLIRVYGEEDITP